MNKTKINFMIKHNDDSAYFLEAELTGDACPSERISPDEKIKVCKHILSESIKQWIETEDGKKFHLSGKWGYKGYNLPFLNSLFGEYYNKSRELRNVLKENGMSKFRIRLFPISSIWDPAECLATGNYEVEIVKEKPIIPAKDLDTIEEIVEDENSPPPKNDLDEEESIIEGADDLADLLGG